MIISHKFYGLYIKSYGISLAQFERPISSILTDERTVPTDKSFLSFNSGHKIDPNQI
jgi:hypothetical protein